MIFFPTRKRRELEKRLSETSHRLSLQIEELNSEKQQLETVLNSMVEGVMVTSLEREITLVNPAFLKMMEIEEVHTGTSILEAVRNISIHDLAGEVLEKGQSKKLPIAIFLNGEINHFIVHTAPLFRDGSVSGSVSVFYDVTELKKLEEIRKDFVTNVSHELKTPLTSIRGYAETLSLLLDRSESFSEKKTVVSFLERIEKNALHLQHLVEDILRLSEIESGRMELDITEIDALNFLESLMVNFKELAESKKIKFDWFIEPGFVSFSADPGALKQILENLVSNAIRYTLEGGEITLSVHSSDNQIRFSIKDNGIGISPEDQMRVFERFFRVDKARTRETGGTGLGLSIVKHLVNAHGGKVGVESMTGHGSLFWFTLPLEKK